ncbi:c-type cytochrome [Ramlibacter sp.]|uniref:c-type cytochrome n=1 Tax=Ramlibacter sp. TaxID=1917967 RepID=UPI003D0B8361
MGKWLRIGLGVIAVLAAVAALGVLAGLEMYKSRTMRKVNVNVQAVAAAKDPQALARGKYLFETRGCTDCHGNDGAGRSFANDSSIHIAGPNITPAGVVAQYRAEDWVRIIRHGVKPDGRPAMVMPSEDYNRLTDADLAGLIGYIQSLAPRRGGPAIVELPLPARVAYGFGAIQDASEKIDHNLPPQQPIAEAVNPQHGKYVANACIGCHGDTLSGGKIPGGPPDWPAAANLTPGEGTAMTRYKDAAAFTAMMRSGKRPDGTAIAVMPFESIGRMSDVDVQALYAYLKTVPAKPAGQR